MAEIESLKAQLVAKAEEAPVELSESTESAATGS